MVGQSSEGMGGQLSTPYKSEINVKLVEKQDRADPSNIYAAKMKRELSKIIVGAKIKTVPISILGMAEQAPIEMIVTGSNLDSVLKFAESARLLLAKVLGAP